MKGVDELLWCTKCCLNYIQSTTEKIIQLTNEVALCRSLSKIQKSWIDAEYLCKSGRFGLRTMTKIEMSSESNFLWDGGVHITVCVCLLSEGDHWILTLENQSKKCTVLYPQTANDDDICQTIIIVDDSTVAL